MHRSCTILSLLSFAAMNDNAIAQPSFGHDFVTVGAAGNAAYSGQDLSPGGLVTGRGSVNYDFRIARTEITTAQWLEFVNTFANTDEAVLPVRAGRTMRASTLVWGATISGTGVGEPLSFALRSDLPDAAQRPVSGMSWEGAAMYCNWLHHGKSTDPALLWSGAYDATTWTLTYDGNVPVPHHGDRLAGAQFWMPSLDEWLKASYYDPILNNGAGGWWLYANSSNQPPTPGLPGIGQTSASLTNGWELPVGAYPSETSPWGLLDASGSRKEWTDSWLDGALLGLPRTTQKFTAGTSVQFTLEVGPLGRIDEHSASVPYFPGFIDVGFRIASSVPSPGACVPGVALVLWASKRRRR